MGKAKGKSFRARGLIPKVQMQEDRMQTAECKKTHKAKLSKGRLSKMANENSAFSSFGILSQLAFWEFGLLSQSAFCPNRPFVPIGPTVSPHRVWASELQSCQCRSPRHNYSPGHHICLKNEFIGLCSERQHLLCYKGIIIKDLGSIPSPIIVLPTFAFFFMSKQRQFSII